MLNKPSPFQKGDYMCNGKIMGMGSLAYKNWLKLRAFSLLSMINGTSPTCDSVNISIPLRAYREPPIFLI